MPPGWPIRVHLVRLLLHFLSVLLVECRQGLPGPGCAHAGLPLDRRLTRRSRGVASQSAPRPNEHLPMPHDIQLYQLLSQSE